MKFMTISPTVRTVIATCSFFLLANFSSQDSTTAGGVKPAVNFYGTVTDTSDKTFNAINITFERMYKQIPVYQVAPKNATESYDPTANLTRLDLSEISKVVFSENQKPQKFSNREYLIAKVYSRDKNQTEHEYLVEADKKLICDEKNDAGPIEKEIKFRAVREVVVEGYKQSETLESDKQQNKRNRTTEDDHTPSSKIQKPEEKNIKSAHVAGTRRKRLLGYFQELFGVNKQG